MGELSWRRTEHRRSIYWTNRWPIVTNTEAAQWPTGDQPVRIGTTNEGNLFCSGSIGPPCLFRSHSSMAVSEVNPRILAFDWIDCSHIPLSRQTVGEFLKILNDGGHPSADPIGSMYAIYDDIYHQYTPVMLAYIYQHHGSVEGVESCGYVWKWGIPPIIAI